jgi:hypothetical protein
VRPQAWSVLRDPCIFWSARPTLHFQSYRIVSLWSGLNPQANLVVNMEYRLSSLIAITIFLGISKAYNETVDARCAVPWEYWCEDRCGADSYGDTCCEISGGRHNLCGLGKVLVIPNIRELSANPERYFLLLGRMLPYRHVL